MSIKKYTRPERVAILLLSFGEDIAGEILGKMPPHEVQKVSAALSRLSNVDGEIVNGIVEEFLDSLSNQKKTFEGGLNFTTAVLNKAMSKDAASKFITQLEDDQSSLESLEGIEPEDLARMIANEAPQTIAIILAHCDSKKCGDTLKRLPPQLHVEILMRIAKLEAVSPEMLQEIDDYLREESRNMGNTYGSKKGGKEAVAAILAAMGGHTDTLDGIEERDPDLAEGIRDLMFVFSDLSKLSDAHMQTLLAAVPVDLLKFALRKCSTAVEALVYKNMSSRASSMLKEDIASMSKVKISDVEDAQKKILLVAKDLEEAGKLVLGDNGEEYV